MHKCLIVGCGKIAGYFGELDNNNHAGSISLNKDLNFLPKYIKNNIDEFKKWIKKE